MTTDYTLFVNSCDSFEDCWNPFFKLMVRYWPDFDGQIMLNTEYKNYSFGRLDIRASQVCDKHYFPRSKRAPWGLCTRWGIEALDTEIVLYMQEDYFLNAKVDNAEIARCVEVMAEYPEICCIHLTNKTFVSNEPSVYDGLDIFAINQHYRVSCQAALWRKSELLALLRDRENGWEYEEFGTRRSKAMGHLYLHSRRAKDTGDVVPYVFTGIEQGRWNDDVVDLFKDSGISVDFSKRGFISSAPAKTLLAKIKHFAYKAPHFIINEAEVLKIRMESQQS
jgi:hypothetical protein